MLADGGRCPGPDSVWEGSMGILSIIGAIVVIIVVLKVLGLW